MSRFCDVMYANARTSTRGMVTGEPGAPVRHSWGEVHERARAISGGLAGLAGVIQVIGVEGRMDTGISAGYGFTAIIVALLGRLDAFGVLLAALLISFLQTGGQAMSIDNHLPYSIILAIEGVFVLFVLTADRFAR